MLRTTSLAAAAVLATMTSLVTAAPVSSSPQAVSQKLLVGAPGQILTYDLSGKQFTLTSKYAEAGTASSWMLPRGGDSDQLYAVNENADDLRLFGFADKVIAPGATPTKFTGSTGVVSLAFNADKTRLLGGGYSNGEVDVWNSEAADGSLTLIKTLKLTGALGPQQTSHRAHQVLLDPTGQFFAVPDLGGDQVVLVDARADKYELVGTTVPTGAGTGPRHGQFIGGGGGADGAPATHYVVVTELSNELILYKLTYTSAGISFAEVDRQTTIPAGTPQPIDPAGAAAGEVQVVGATDVYASNRRTGLPTGDSIVFFKLDAASNKLVFKQLVQSGGVFPRHFSFDAQGEVMFVANQGPVANVTGVDSALAAFSRCADTGVLSAAPFATVKYSDVVAAGSPDNSGPQFILPV